MGEVRVTVKLINATDEALARCGKIEVSEIRVYEADAMVDTGAVQTVIPHDVITALGLNLRVREALNVPTDEPKSCLLRKRLSCR